MALYLILRHSQQHPVHTIGGAVGEWFYNIVLYQILLSIVLGAAIGFIARKTLKYAEKNGHIDHDNFLAYGVGLAFFTLGVVGMIGSDDILCCFVVGNAFTWDDWFRVQTEDTAFQDVIDTLLNTAIFLYIGSVLPWNQFGNFWGITPWRLVVLGILVMLVRRVPWVIAMVSSSAPVRDFEVEKGKSHIGRWTGQAHSSVTDLLRSGLCWFLLAYWCGGGVLSSSGI